MNTRMLTVSFLVIIVAVAAFYVWRSTKYSSTVDTLPTPSITNIGGSNTEDLASTRYVEYTPEIAQMYQHNRRVLFFYASWCPTCRPADASITANVNQIPQETTVLRVNYNDPDTDADEKVLAKKYGVTYQHTFVQIDEEGNEVTRWNGGQIEELLANIIY